MFVFDRFYWSRPIRQSRSKLFPKHVELGSYPYARMAMIAFVAAGTAASPRLRHKRELLRTIEISQNVPEDGQSVEP